MLIVVGGSERTYALQKTRDLTGFKFTFTYILNNGVIYNLNVKCLSLSGKAVSMAVSEDSWADATFVFWAACVVRDLSADRR